MPATTAEFAVQLATPMGCYYLFAAAANLAAGGIAWKQKRRLKGSAWILLAAGFGGLSLGAFGGSPLQLPGSVKIAIDAFCTPAVLTLVSFAAFGFFFLAREFFVKPAVAWIGFNSMVLFFGASMTDPNFYAAVMRPDDLPIVAMVFLLGFFLWLAMYQAVQNDRRLGNRQPVIEQDFSQKVLVWPDLVYAELICMVVLSAVLIVWSMLLRAPLEQPANPAITPNPSKAPWYFVGLQELLTYADAWNVGVVVPALAIVGLMAIPYLDRNPAGSGYYSVRGRRFACFVFLFGFLQLWILPILIGTFLRGPNWSSFGLYEARDANKLFLVEHFSLSQAFWTNLLGRPLPEASPAAGGFTRLLNFIYRDWPGVCLMLLYFFALPPLMGRSIFQRFRQSLGGVRFYLMMFLLLYMLTLPIKMVFYWLFGLDSFFG